MTKSLLETDIFNYHTPEFFINMKNIPDKTSVDRKAFVLEEKRKSRDGINVNGVYIPGGLYFHLNYYYLQGDSKEFKGKKDVFLPTLRDNEWIVFNDYDKCQKEGLIYTLFGLRQSGKSEMEVSLCLRELSLFKNTEALALFANNPYRDTFVKKMRTAIDYGEKFMIIPNIDKDWSKEEIRFGITRQDNSIDLRAILYIYNTQEGKRIQVSSGKSASFFLIDEAGASPFRAVYDTVEPALLTDYGGLRCAPMFTLTGGEAEKSKDAENLIRHPDSNKQLLTTLENGLEVGGRFLDGRYRKDCKKQTTVSKFLKKETGTWIDNYSIHISDFNYASSVIEEEREAASESPDRNSLLLKKIFFPLTIDEVFLSESNNNFPIEACKSRKNWLEKEYEPEYIDLYKDDKNNIKVRFSSKKPIFKFPVRPTDNKEAPICVYERPLYDVPNGTYCIGIDPFNEDSSSDKINSLGAIYVYKRMYNPMGAFQNSIVCSWRGRTKTVKEFHELCLLISEWYNAIDGVLPENEDKTLIQYFFLKKKGHYLADSMELAKQINPLTKSNRLKGLSASTSNQRHYMNLMIEEVKEEVELIEDDGTPEGKISVVMGVNKINDPMLLEEMIQYRGKSSASRGIHDGNYDSIVAFGHCLTLARYHDIKYPNNWKPKNKEVVKYKESLIKTPWGNMTKGSPFIKSKPFHSRGISIFPR